ncbi:MAG: response regulator, partial [Clostridiales bacterium]
MTNKQEILVVEDEQSISNFICAILHSHDYLPISAMTGKEAMALLSGRVPELMILDLGLPDMDGLEIIRQVRQWSQLPIIV